MKHLLLMLVLMGPVVTRWDGCDGKYYIDEEATCQKLCQIKTGKFTYKVEVLGRTGRDQWRVCACYTERTIVVDDLPMPVEAEDKKVKAKR